MKGKPYFTGKTNLRSSLVASVSFPYHKNFFRTLSSDSCLKIVYFLYNNGPDNVSEISQNTGLEQSTASHCLKKLLDCQIVHLHPQGKKRIYSLNKKTIDPLMKLINRHVKKYCKGKCKECDGNEE